MIPPILFPKGFPGGLSQYTSTSMDESAPPKGTSPFTVIGDGLRAANRAKSYLLRTLESKRSRDAYIEVEAQSDEGSVIESWREYRFVISSIDMPKAERVQVMPTFGDDPDVLVTFGRDSIIWSFEGMLRNELGQQGDWVGAFDYRYQNQLRASVLARDRKIMRLVIGDVDIEGYMLDLTLRNGQGTDDAGVPFRFRMLVRNYDKLMQVEGVDESLAFDDFDDTVPQSWASFKSVDPLTEEQEA